MSNYGNKKPRTILEKLFRGKMLQLILKLLAAMCFLNLTIYYSSFTH